jgi:hypothetical protein
MEYKGTKHKKQDDQENIMLKTKVKYHLQMIKKSIMHAPQEMSIVQLMNGNQYN